MTKMLQLPVGIDVAFEPFSNLKAQINQVQDVSQKVTLHRPNSLTRWMANSNKLEIAPDSHVRKACGVISNPLILEHVQHKRKIACHAETQPLFLQMSLPKVDFAYAL